MALEPQTMERELNILFGALCDGIRQEVRFRRLAQLTNGQDFSLSQEREPGVQFALALHLRSVGFLVQVESWIAHGSLMRRPDFRVWLPASEKYLYLELKTYGWGRDWSYQYSTMEKSVQEDMDKLKIDGDSGNLPNGLIVVGLSQPSEQRVKHLDQAYEDLSHLIISGYPYEKIGVKKVDLSGMDPRTSYAMVGLWGRTPATNNGVETA